MTRVIIVTGCASGIGHAQATAFLAQGDIVCGLDIASPHIMNPHFHWFHCDVTQATQVRDTVQQIIAQFQHIDVLCNTAGILDNYHTTLDTTLEQWEQVIATNVTGPFLMTNAVLPDMIANKCGTIINMVSIASLVAGGGGAAYTVAKHALAGYTKQVALDYAHLGIRVNAIAPGAVQTAMTASDFAGDGNMAHWVAEQTPVKRWAQPEEIAQVTTFLASDSASYLQGAIIPVDGGWLLR